MLHGWLHVWERRNCQHVVVVFTATPGLPYQQVRWLYCVLWNKQIDGLIVFFKTNKLLDDCIVFFESNNLLDDYVVFFETNKLLALWLDGVLWNKQTSCSMTILCSLKQTTKQIDRWLYCALWNKQTKNKSYDYIVFFETNKQTTRLVTISCSYDRHTTSSMAMSCSLK